MNMKEIPNRLFKRIKQHLMDGEKIVHKFEGLYWTHNKGTNSSISSSSEWEGSVWGSPWLILTDKRLLIACKGIFTFDIREIPYEHIKSMDYEEGFLEDRIMFFAHSSSEAIRFSRFNRKKTVTIPRIIKKFEGDVNGEN